MKKIISFLLIACILSSLCISALAQSESELAEVTLKVKDTLDILEDYSNFSGNFEDYLVKRWFLSWSEEDKALSVYADDNGKIFTYRSNEYSGTQNYYRFEPKLPEVTLTEAKEISESFLERVMDEKEKARIETEKVLLSGESAGFSFSGTILLNNLSSPLIFSVTTDAKGKTIDFTVRMPTETTREKFRPLMPRSAKKKPVKF